jgi:hypothetical protein
VRDGRKCSIEPVERRRLPAESPVGEPEARADVCAVAYPWKVDADDETIRLVGSKHQWQTVGFPIARFIAAAE